MPNKTTQLETVIRGSCSFFVCRMCRTKYGWEHQAWCDYAALTQPECKDCAYYEHRLRRCRHPAKKRKWRDAG